MVTDLKVRAEAMHRGGEGGSAVELFVVGISFWALSILVEKKDPTHKVCQIRFVFIHPLYETISSSFSSALEGSDLSNP